MSAFASISEEQTHTCIIQCTCTCTCTSTLYIHEYMYMYADVTTYMYICIYTCSRENHIHVHVHVYIVLHTYNVHVLYMVNVLHYIKGIYCTCILHLLNSDLMPDGLFQLPVPTLYSNSSCFHMSFNVICSPQHNTVPYHTCTTQVNTVFTMCTYMYIYMYMYMYMYMVH